MATEKITIPDLGDASEVEVIELLVAVGDTVAENDSLLVLESDKAAMEIPAPVAGVVKSIEVNLGDQISTGSPMMTLEVDSVAEAEATTDAEKDTAAAEAEADADSEPEPASVTETSAPTPTEATKTLTVPDLGTEDEVEVIEVHVAVGDHVSVEDTLITLESDKAAMEVPATAAGTIEKLLIQVGDKIKTGADILTMKISSVAAAPAAESKRESGRGAKRESRPAPMPAPESKPSAFSPIPAPTPVPTAADKSTTQVASASASPASVTSGKVYAGPAVRKLARELGVDLGLVAGTGARSRIVKADIQAFVKSRITGQAVGAVAATAIPDVDFSRFGEIEEVPRSKMQKVTATNMQRNWSAVPHVAHFNEADVTELEAFRAELKAEAEQRGIKITLLPFLLKACAKALAEYPQFNVSLHSSGEYIIQKKYCHIGIAVATEAGLVVPVMRDVDRKSVWDLAAEIIELTHKAKQRKLSLEEMQGACFTVSSLGALGGTGFIPIINAPEVAILGVAKTQIKPVYREGEFVPRKLLPFTLCYDHKAVNGLDGGLFAEYLANLLADIRHLVL